MILPKTTTYLTKMYSHSHNFPTLDVFFRKNSRTGGPVSLEPLFLVGIITEEADDGLVPIDS